VRQLKAGALAAGFPTELWTLPRIAQLIEQRFAVRLTQPSVWRLLRALGWSVQRPTGQARQRDEKAIRTWKAKRWPELKNRGATRPSDRLHRRVGPLRTTLSRTHLGPAGRDAGVAVQLQLEAAVGDRRHLVLALLLPPVPRRDPHPAGTRVPQGAAGHDRPQAADRLGPTAGASLQARSPARRGRSAAPSRSSTCRLTPRSSTRWSASGATSSTTPCRTTAPPISVSSSIGRAATCAPCSADRRWCERSGARQNCSEWSLTYARLNSPSDVSVRLAP
jgi:hypothetical protein